MSLNDIQFTGFVLSGLYPRSIVMDDTGVSESKAVPEKPVQEPARKWLGENSRQILILVRHKEITYLPDPSLQFLTAMLNACKLSLKEVAILNIETMPSHEFTELSAIFGCRVLIAFGMEPSEINLPLHFPEFQIQPFSGCSFLFAPPLEQLENDKVLKSKLWVSLKRLFNI